MQNNGNSKCRKKGKITNGSIAYITLEPCNHFGRTPPCTEALLWAGINEVVIAHIDPNPTVKGGGIKALKDAEIDVRLGCCESELRNSNAIFFLIGVIKKYHLSH